MALATLENVIATVADGSHVVSLTIDDDGLVVGRFGKLRWAGAEMGAEVVADGCVVHLSVGPDVRTRYFIPVESFSAFGGVQMMATFADLLMRCAASAGARVVQPAA